MSADVIDSLLLTAARIITYAEDQALPNASGFFFARDGRLYLITSRHVMCDPAIGHYPTRIELELHTDPQNLTRSIGFSIPLYRANKRLWLQAQDGGGDIDIALIELDRAALPERMVYKAFTAKHLVDGGTKVEIGCPLLILGFPLGFHDTLHHLPVARKGGLASSFNLRFQGQGYFLTDARTHQGGSGAPVVTRIEHPVAGQTDLPWRLLGVHSARLDMLSRNTQVDEALGLNCAWYADVLLTLTA